MSDRKSPYERILEDFDDYTEKIREEFVAKAGENDKMNIETAAELLDGVAQILDVNLDSAKTFFARDNEPVERYFNLDALSGDDFLEVFKMWLKKKIENKGKGSNQDSKSQQENEEGSERGGAEEEEAREESEKEEEREDREEEEVRKDLKGDDSEEENNEEREERREREPEEAIPQGKEENGQELDDEDMIEFKALGDLIQENKTSEPKSEPKPVPVRTAQPLPANYRNNREKLDELLLKNREKLCEVFESRQLKNTGMMSLDDYFNFLHECFSNSNIQVLASRSHEDDFFKLTSNNYRLLKTVEGYFVNVRGKKTGFDIDEVRLNFDECFDVLDYWFRTDNQVILLEKSEKTRPQRATEGRLVESRAGSFVSRSQSTNGGKTDVKVVLLETISKYRRMIQDCDNDVERSVLQTTVDTLYQKLRQLENGEITSSANSQLRQEYNIQLLKRKEDKKMKALKEIFEFYSKQQLGVGKPATFDTMEKQFNNLNLGKFSVVIKNYRMKMDPFKLKETFKKVSSNSDYINFNEFILMFYKISKDVELITEKKVYKQVDNRKDYRPDSYKQTPSQTSIKGSSSKTRESELSKRDEGKLEEIWNHMGLYDGLYRTNLLTVQLAFNSQDKETFRIPLDTITQKMKYKGFTEEIKEEVAQRNELRKIVKDIKITEKSILKNFKDTPSKASPRTYRSMNEGVDSYASLQAQKASNKRIFPEKMTLKDVGRSNHMELRGLAFNPDDLINENDEEDNIYLADYRIAKNPVKEKEQENLKKAEAHTTSKILKEPKTKASSPVRDHSRKEVRTKRTDGRAPSVELKAPSKPITMGDLDHPKYVINSPNHNIFYDKPPGLYPTNSVKHMISNPNLKNIYPQLKTNIQDMVNPNMQYYMHTPAYGDKIQYQQQQYRTYEAANRAQKVQQASKKKEEEMMMNMMNIHNSKIEQGLRVARK